MAVVSSDSFLHFTGGGLEVLQLILKNGFKLSLCDEITGYIKSDTNEEMITALAIPMICFCDIPPPAIASHAEFYCKNPAKPKTEIFGIGMKREWGRKVGLNPVAYTSPSSYNFENNQLEDLVYDFLVMDHLKHKQSGEITPYPVPRATAIHHIHLKNHSDGFLNFHPRRSFYTKYTQGNYYRLNKSKIYDADGNIQYLPYREFIEMTPDHNFYNEREWRYIPHWLEKINVFQSEIMNERKKDILIAEDDYVFDNDFADNAFFCYLTERDWVDPKSFLRYSFDDISVIVVDNEDAKNELIQSITTFDNFGGYDIDHDVLKALPNLIMTYADFQALENK